MQIRNAITAVFDSYPVQEHYGADKARVMCNRVLGACPLDAMKDEPLPEWAINILKFGMLGYRERIRMLFMHHGDITGMPVQHYLVSPDGKTPSWVGKARNKAVRDGLRAEQKMIEEDLRK